MTVVVLLTVPGVIGVEADRASRRAPFAPVHAVASPAQRDGAPTQEPDAGTEAVATSLPAATVAPGPVEMSAADVVPGELDPATLPTRRISRAAVLVPVVKGSDTTWIALDADTGTWVVPELGTGRTVEVAYPYADGCGLEGIAWVPDTTRLGLALSCIDREALRADPTLRPRGRMLEVDVTTGDTHEWPGTMLSRGAPWQSPSRVLVGDPLWSYADDDHPLLLDAVSGGSVAFGPGWLLLQNGLVAGSALATASQDGRHDCPVAMCTFDADNGSIVPWLTLPSGMTAGVPLVARDLVPAG